MLDEVGIAELLDLIAEELCADAFDIDRTAPWREQLETGLRQFRRLVLAHRDVATLLRDRPATGPNRLGHIETTLRILLDAHLSVDDAAGISPAPGHPRTHVTAGHRATE